MRVPIALGRMMSAAIPEIGRLHNFWRPWGSRDRLQQGFSRHCGLVPLCVFFQCALNELLNRATFWRRISISVSRRIRRPSIC